MIEVNRSLYMDEKKCIKRGNFESIREELGVLLSSIRRGEKSFAQKIAPTVRESRRDHKSGSQESQ